MVSLRPCPVVVGCRYRGPNTAALRVSSVTLRSSPKSSHKQRFRYWAIKPSEESNKTSAEIYVSDSVFLWVWRVLELQEELEDVELPEYVPDPLLNADSDDENVDLAQVDLEWHFGRKHLCLRWIQNAGWPKSLLTSSMPVSGRVSCRDKCRCDQVVTLKTSWKNTGTT